MNMISSFFIMSPARARRADEASESTRETKLCRVVDAAGLHHLPDALRIANVLQRVALEQDDVSELAWREGAGIGGCADLIGGTLGGHAEDVDRREAGIDELRDLPVQRQA